MCDFHHFIANTVVNNNKELFTERQAKIENHY